MEGGNVAVFVSTKGLVQVEKKTKVDMGEGRGDWEFWENKRLGI